MRRENQEGSTLVIVLLVVVIVLIVAGTWYLGSQKANPSVPLPSPAVNSTESTSGVQTNSSNTYQNSNLGYSFVIPSGYRLATGYIQSYNSSLGYPQANYTTSTVLNVFITRNSIEQESSTSQPVNTANTPAYSPFPNTISVFAIGPNWENLKTLHDQLVQEGKTPPFQNITLADGTSAYRETAINPDTGASTTEILFVPLNSSVVLPSGSPVTLIVISMPESGFDSNAFDQVIGSFRLK